jgi:hypothetical protein
MEALVRVSTVNILNDRSSWPERRTLLAEHRALAGERTRRLLGPCLPNESEENGAGAFAWSEENGAGAFACEKAPDPFAFPKARANQL